MKIVTSAAGAATTASVARAIDEAKDGQALRPVRVIVSSNLAGLSLRRLLGSQTGIANVNFSTPFQFASLLAAPTLAAKGLRPLTTSVLAAAVRHVLSTSPGRFAVVAKHVATETALIRAYGEITEMPPSEREALAASSTPRTQELLEFISAVDEHLRSGTSATYHDEFTVLREAVSVAQSNGGPSSEGHDRLVLVGPFTQGLATVQFLADIVAARESGLSIGVWATTGDQTVDSAVFEQAQIISGSTDALVTTEATSVPNPTALVPTADSDEEVREVVRSILVAAERGVRFDRMAVFVPSAGPYMRTLREQLDRAEIPSAGPEHRTLGDSITGRLLSTLLELADASERLPAEKAFLRETVLALVNSAPLRGRDGKPLRSSSWENISRKAGVVSGLDGWARSLSIHVESIEKRIEDNSTSSEGFLGSLRREKQAVEALGGFVAWLGELTSPSNVGGTWTQRAAWARKTLTALLPAENRRSQWPESEVDTAQRIDKVLSRVGVLDDVEPNPAPSSFARAIQLELDAPAGRRGRFGTGVLVAPLSSAVGLDLDEVFILGLAEGICPRPIREDTLVPDEERLLTNGGLPTRVDKNREERQRYLHALAAGRTASTLTTPLGDHRTGRQRTVSRWWIDALRTLSGDQGVTSRNWLDQESLLELGRGSYQQSLDRALAAGTATTPADLFLQHIHARTEFGIELDEGLLAPELRRGLEMIDERLSGFNRFTGDLGGIKLASPASDGKAVSPSLLEQWATCPRRYFLARVLGLVEIERPEAIAEISALDRGSLVHAILEDFIRDSLPPSENAISDPDQPWTDADRDRLMAFAEKHFKEYEDLNRTGKPILWAIRKEETLADLETFLRRDEKMRQELRTVPRAVELPFGMGERYEQSADAAIVELPGADDRRLSLRGFIDRVDTKTGDAPVVIDYKTSKATLQKRFDEDPVLGGTKLQLGAYAYAAKQEFASEQAHAYYWYASSKGNFQLAGYQWTGRQDERFLDAVETIIDGIEAGQFPPNPGDYDYFYGTFKNCRFCDFKRLCPVDRDEEFEKAVESGRLFDYVTMQSPVDEEQDGS